MVFKIKIQENVATPRYSNFKTFFNSKVLLKIPQPSQSSRQWGREDFQHRRLDFYRLFSRYVNRTIYYSYLMRFKVEWGEQGSGGDINILKRRGRVLIPIFLFLPKVRACVPLDLYVGIASGFPFAGLAAKASLFQNLNPGSMGSTYGSNAIGCAAAVATLDAIEQENMLENASKRGLELMKGLCRIAQETGKDVITDVRGRGLMVAVEFKGPKGFANLVTKCALKRQTLMLTAGAKEVVRFLPPLNISQEEVQASLDVFEASLKEGVELKMKQT
eukprot:TRINITY_DN3187_c1_g1_i3.p2 TRINITY_DN3187_c1_g1~~TRINITY_DN3187_c1_g1_i3.p2  ORF type:complete len:275 (+),score=29.48 TRINITY_DN3187_c1_g1_i3:233-1057(+)